MLIIVADSFYNHIVPLRDWRIRKGMKTDLVKCSSIGTTPDAIKTYLQAKYYTDSLAYVLLVGDGVNSTIPTKSIPYFTYIYSPELSIPTDLEYTLLEGDENDLYPDIYLARFSPRSNGDVDNFVNRVIKYETNPAPGNWNQKAAFFFI